MKTPLGEVDDSWADIIGTKASLLMLETIKVVCRLQNHGVLDLFRQVRLDQLKAVVIVDNAWGPYVNPMIYDKSLPPDQVIRVSQLLQKYPDVERWSEQGVIALAYPLHVPVGEKVRARFRPVWEGWFRLILTGLSARKKTNRYAFLLMGRESQRLKSSITLTMPVVETADPIAREYVASGTCGFTELSKKAKLEICW